MLEYTCSLSVDKIGLYRDFLWKINYSNGLLVEPQHQVMVDLAVLDVTAVSFYLLIGEALVLDKNCGWVLL